MENRRLVRFPYLQERGIADHRAQVQRLVKDHGFPPGFLLSSNVRVWEVADVEGWLARRRDAPQARSPESLRQLRELGRKGGRTRWARDRAAKAAGQPGPTT